MTIYAQPGASFETFVSGFPTGETGSVGVRIGDGVGGTVVNRTTAGIVEFPAGSGVYVVTLTAPTTAGQYIVVWDVPGGGGGGGGGQDSYGVTPLVVTSTGAQAATPSGADLVTLGDVRRELEMPTSDTSRDELAQVVITQVSRAITTYCQREFRTTTTGETTRRFKVPAGVYLVDLNPYDLHDAAGLTVTINPDDASGGTTLTVNTDYRLNPVDPTDTFLSLSISRDVAQLHTGQDARRFGYTIAAVTSSSWGFASVPEDVRRAAIIAVAANMDRRLDGFGGVQDLVDTDLGLQPLRAPSFALPTATIAMLAPYRRSVGAF
jgi:hypothetical protein